jgi:hypothetical protein
MLLVSHEHRELAFENVERVRVPPVEVRSGSRPCTVEPRLRDGELLERGLDHDPAAEQGLAVPRAMNNPSHGASMTIRAVR